VKEGVNPRLILVKKSVVTEQTLDTISAMMEIYRMEMVVVLNAKLRHSFNVKAEACSGDLMCAVKYAETVSG
jgi:hypothetical protein